MTDLVGASVRRREDARLLTGRGRFVDDIILPGMLHAAMVRSPHAHARVLAIDAAPACNVPSVRGVFTAADVPEAAGDIPPLAPTPAFRPYRQPLMAAEPCVTPEKSWRWWWRTAPMRSPMLPRW